MNHTLDRPMHRRTALALVGGALATSAAPAFAQDAGKAARDLALYTGADREARLIELAKKEGELSVYHVYPALPAVMTAFTKKTGIKVRAWRSGSEAVLQRVLAEARGGRFEVDIVQNNAPEQEAATSEKLLQEVWSPGLKDLLPGTAPAHRCWAGIALDVWVAAYNTQAVKPDEVPRSYADLLDPRWKGRLAIEANNHVWFNTLLAEMGEDSGLKFFNQLVASNGISARKGHSVLANLVASGDIPLALTVYSWIPEQLKKKGAPIASVALQPLLSQASAVALMRRAPNPASALLFHDFMVGLEGQKVMADAQFVPTNRLVDSPWARTPMKMVDAVRALENQDRWQKLFDDTIIKRAK